MPKITIYTTPICPYCVRAKALLKKKGAMFDEIDVFMNVDARREMENRAGGRYTVPQIFIGEHHVGGCDDLYALERAGELDPLLSAAA
jgi:glutaredoxin 3